MTKGTRMFIVVMYAAALVGLTLILLLLGVQLVVAMATMAVMTALTIMTTARALRGEQGGGPSDRD